jgi:hypothetical protein
LAKFVAGKYVPLHGIHISTRITCLHNSVPERLVVNTTCLHGSAWIGRQKAFDAAALLSDPSSRKGRDELERVGGNNSLLNG